MTFQSETFSGSMIYTNAPIIEKRTFPQNTSYVHGVYVRTRKYYFSGSSCLVVFVVGGWMGGYHILNKAVQTILVSNTTFN
jgi:hypothetical protein